MNCTVTVEIKRPIFCYVSSRKKYLRCFDKRTFKK